MAPKTPKSLHQSLSQTYMPSADA